MEGGDSSSILRNINGVTFCFVSLEEIYLNRLEVYGSKGHSNDYDRRTLL